MALKGQSRVIRADNCNGCTNESCPKLDSQRIYPIFTVMSFSSSFHSPCLFHAAGCWAFTAADAVSAAYAILTYNPAPELSVQEILDCSTGDCLTGGYPGDAFRFIANPPASLSGMLALESDYPFDGVTTGEVCTVRGKAGGREGGREGERKVEREREENTCETMWSNGSIACQDITQEGICACSVFCMLPAWVEWWTRQHMLGGRVCLAYPSFVTEVRSFAALPSG